MFACHYSGCKVEIEKEKPSQHRKKELKTKIETRWSLTVPHYRLPLPTPKHSTTDHGKKEDACQSHLYTKIAIAA